MGTTALPLNYTPGNDSATITYTPQNKGTTTITITLQDDGGNQINNGDQQTQISFDLEVTPVPLTGYIVPLENFDTTTASVMENVGDWKIEGNLSSQFCETGSFHGFDTVLKIECVDKFGWNGLWHRCPDLDLRNFPYISYDIYVENNPIQTHCYFWDDNGKRNAAGAHNERKDIPVGTWTSVTMNFNQDGYMVDGSNQPINAKRIQQILINYSDEFNWPFDDGGNFTVYFKNIRVGSEALNVPPPYCTIKGVGDQIFYSNPGQQTILLANITDGDIGNDLPLVSASSDNPGFVPDPSVTAVDTNGNATLTYTPGTGINAANITLTVSAANSLDKQITFRVITVSPDPGNAETIAINQGNTYQVIHGLGTVSFSSRYLDKIIKDQGSSAIRISLDASAIEPENDNNDPLILNRDNLNYSSINWQYYRNLKEAGAENFILAIYSPPAWMKDDLSSTYGYVAFHNWNTTQHRLSTWYYDEFAETVVALVKMFQEKCGINLYAIAPQRTPQHVAPWPSCVYDPEHYVDIINKIGDRFTAEGISTKIMLPDQPTSFGTYPVQQYIDAVQADPTADPYTGAISIENLMGTGMGAGVPDFTNWTNLYNEVSSGSDPKELYVTRPAMPATDQDILWDSAMAFAGSLYGALEFGSVSLITYGNINNHYIYKEQPTDYFYVAKHFNKFIRPEAIRVESTDSEDDILVTSYLNDPFNRNTLVSVFINKGNNPFTTQMAYAGGPVPDTIDIYRSTSNSKCEMIATQLSDSIFILPPNSVTTVVAHGIAYDLTVNKGAGSGRYGPGAMVDIVADDPPMMKLFDCWTGSGAGSVANVDTSITTLTMPAGDIEITASYRDINTYKLIVHRGTGTGKYAFGSPVLVVADSAHIDSLFYRWNGDTTYVHEPGSFETAVTMPKDTVEIWPVYIPKLKINAKADVNYIGDCPAADSATMMVQVLQSVAASFAWSPANGLKTTTQDTLKAKPANTTTYIVTVTDIFGNDRSDTVIIRVDSLDVTGGADRNAIGACRAADSAKIWVNTKNGIPATFNWGAGNGLGSNNGDTAMVHPGTSSTYIATVTDVYGCTDTTNEISVEVNPVQVTTIDDDTIQMIDTITLQTKTTGDGPFTFLWFPDDSSLNDISSANPLLVNNTLGISTFAVEVTDKYGCSNSDTVNIIISCPYAYAGEDIFTCDEHINASAILTNGTGVWTMLSGPGNIAFSDSSDANTLITPSKTGSYELIWTGLYNQCVVNDTVVIIFAKAPSAGGDTSFYTCSSEIIYLPDILTADADSGGIFSETDATGRLNGNSFNALNLPAGSGEYLVQYKVDMAGCDADSSVIAILTDTEPPVIQYCPMDTTFEASVETNSITNEHAQLDPVVTDNCGYILVNDLNNDSTLSGANLSNNTIITWYAVDYAGNESDRCSYTVHVSTFVIPNLFTPNSDGHNDTWDFELQTDHPEAVIEVFNRWGQLVYKSDKGYIEKWDGKSNGAPLPEDAYHYFIRENENKLYDGTITIIR